MPAFTRSSGSWRSVQTVYSKSESSWGRVAAGWVHDGTEWKQFFQSGIRDHFDRSAGSLGKTSDGKQDWSLTRGSWSVTSSKARTSTSASSYPIASIDLGTNLGVMEADTPVPGSGVAFGVVDADNWFGAYISRRTLSYDCNPTPCNPVCVASSCNSCTSGCIQDCYTVCSTCSVCTAYKKLESYRNDDYRCTGIGQSTLYRTGVLRSCSLCSCTNGSTTAHCQSSGNIGTISSVRVCLGTRGCSESTGCGCIQSSTVTDCNTCGQETVCNPCVYVEYENDCVNCGSTCTQYSYSTCYSTCTDSYYSIKLIKSEDGVVSELAASEGTVNGFAPKSIRVETSPTGITATAFANTGHTGDTLSVSSAAIPTGTRQGIMVGPSPASQGIDVDNFYAEETD